VRPVRKVALSRARCAYRSFSCGALERRSPAFLLEQRFSERCLRHPLGVRVYTRSDARNPLRLEWRGRQSPKSVAMGERVVGLCMKVQKTFKGHAEQ
jgi:hypothetical protein